MAIIKCKMCGGDLVLVEGQSVAECEYCGSKQTVPSADNEKKLTLFARAGRLRAACEFDKAAGIYEAIVADFPEEAESYWGLVLCKYGIEYVDDPATGKKIPTCHRSSFDSILEDTDFEQALENADVLARRVYREEAKQIEEIRKGIIAVSASEQPYDIFICYKETDENGDRTLDSVLAQDIYDALTEKGYRVFFSRITLEDKLGQAYEPYIFAALNSAKIMLAVGSCYEHYNAVWVKNEWSRYLKIIAQDKSKYLIPCYKGIDAYDIPKEFVHLQGQDMGKVGAIQDLIRGIEKILPKQKHMNVIHERVVVGGTSGDNKVASLLDRGNMALEDGNWAKADSFFEDVLNSDSRNAQAYLGKTLAMERCRTMEALVRKRKDSYPDVRSERLYIPERDTHIEEMAEQYSLPGYVEPQTIRELYRFDLGYASEVSGRQKQYREEEAWWMNHRELSRAEKFASDDVAEYLRREKKHLFAQLNDRVKKAQEADARSVAKLEAAYNAYIAEADRQAEQMYENALCCREKNYEIWLRQAKNENDPIQLRKLEANFAALGDYKESKNLAEHCRKRAAEEQAKSDAEKERQRVIAEQKRKAQQKRNEIIAVIVAACVILSVIVSIVVSNIIVPGNNYKAAMSLKENGQHREALLAFEALGDYKDAAEQAEILREFLRAEKKRAEESRIAAEKKAEEERLAAEYAAAEVLANNEETAKAAIAFAKLENYSDARERSFTLWDAVAVRKTVAAGRNHTVGLKTNGNVIAAGDNKEGQCDVVLWGKIVEVNARYRSTVGLKSDGTILFTDGVRPDHRFREWHDIVAISSGDHHTVGLKSDGTVVFEGINDYGVGSVSDWSDIVAISTGDFHTVGLKTDGTVVATEYSGNYYENQCNVTDWRDIVAISASAEHTVGLKANGTVVAVGAKSYAHKLAEWNDIVAISTAENHTVGLKTDGTVVAAGENDKGQCDVSRWRNIVSVEAGNGRTIGIKADGTVVVTGVYGGVREVSDWSGIKLPQ